MSNLIGSKMSRRTLLTSPLVGAALFAVRPSLEAAMASSPTDGPAVETASGKIRGIANNGVHVFRGIPYGAPTSGANRFRAPRKPEPWTGIRNACQNAHSAMQIPVPASPIGAGLRANPLLGEDCLALNVFTPTGRSTRGRPVMFWIHGGGYAYSSGTTLCADGTNLARSGDVTVVCVNHRLNVFGYLYLDELGGGKYDGSGNAGMLDLVAALQWVHDNIANFGGDPGNVTIFGQSGGGGKVSTLMAMPAARGLFHRASIQSGSSLTGMTKDRAHENTEKLLANLGLKPNQVDELQNMPAPKVLAAMTASRVGFSPVVDGKALPRHPFDPTAPEISADVPLMVGTTETEGTYDVPELVEMDEATLRSRLRGPRFLGEDADRIIELYRRKRPHATPAELYFTICAIPLKANRQVERKAAQGKAPAYLWQINWRSPVRDGLFMSPHCFELPFVFNNVWHMPEMVGTGPEFSRWLTRSARPGSRSHEPETRITPGSRTGRRSTRLNGQSWSSTTNGKRSTI